MKVAIIGICGANARKHLNSYKELDEQISVVVDTNPKGQLIADELNCTFLDDYAKLDASMAEIASVSLPPYLHARVVEHLISKGIHVLCEKPLPLTASEGQRLKGIIETGKVSVMVGFCLRFSKKFMAIRELIEQGKIGTPVQIRSRYSAPSAIEGSWRADPDMGGGIMLVNSVHYFDLAPWLIGSGVMCIDAYGDSAFHGQSAEDNAHIILSHENGCKTIIDANYWNVNSSTTEFEVIGTKGRTFILQNTVIMENSDGTDKIEIENDKMYLAEVSHFIESVKSGNAPQPGISEGINAAILAENAALSMKRGERIWLKD
ncbi:Gfo/Idh/MocA family oxidoreductase [bacterium]|nr:Gfo/Idh/MocA family oxidoreductase [bacterium]